MSSGKVLLLLFVFWSADGLPDGNFQSCFPFCGQEVDTPSCFPFCDSNFNHVLPAQEPTHSQRPSAPKPVPSSKRNPMCINNFNVLISRSKFQEEHRESVWSASPARVST